MKEWTPYKLPDFGQVTSAFWGSFFFTVQTISKAHSSYDILGSRETVPIQSILF